MLRHENKIKREIHRSTRNICYDFCLQQKIQNVSLKCRANIRLHFTVTLQALLRIKGYILSHPSLHGRHWPVLLKGKSPIKLCSTSYHTQLDMGLTNTLCPTERHLPTLLYFFSASKKAVQPKFVTFTTIHLPHQQQKSFLFFQCQLRPILTVSVLL